MVTHDWRIPTNGDSFWRGSLLISLLAHLCLVATGWMIFNQQPQLKPARETIRVELIKLKPVKTVVQPVIQPRVVPPEPKPAPPKPIKKVVPKKPVPPPKVQPKPKPVAKVLKPAKIIPPPVPEPEPVAQPEPQVQYTPAPAPAQIDLQAAREPVNSAPAAAQASVVEIPVPGISMDRLEAIRNSYLTTLKNRIEHHKQYPLMSRKSRQQGVVVVEFELTQKGEVRSSRIKQPSGHRMLDKAALRAVKAASPFPKLPEEIELVESKFVLPIKFVLTR